MWSISTYIQILLAIGGIYCDDDFSIFDDETKEADVFNDSLSRSPLQLTLVTKCTNEHVIHTIHLHEKMEQEGVIDGVKMMVRSPSQKNQAFGEFNTLYNKKLQTKTFLKSANALLKNTQLLNTHYFMVTWHSPLVHTPPDIFLWMDVLLRPNITLTKIRRPFEACD